MYIRVCIPLAVGLSYLIAILVRNPTTVSLFAGFGQLAKSGSEWQVVKNSGCQEVEEPFGEIEW